MMTARARELGLSKSVFRNATGLPDPEQKSTMREIAKLSEHLIRRYPEQYGVFGLREFTWNKVRQQNRNPLLTMEIGADGLKTGMIADSGFSLAASAVQNGQRLIVVISGLPTAQGRAQEARKLFDYGFRGFETRQIFAADAVIGQAKVYGGASGSVDLVTKQAVNVLIPRGSQDRLSARIVYTGPLLAPVKAGDKVGVLKVGRGDIQALDIPLYAAADIPTGSLTQRATDAAFEYGGQLVRQLLGNRLGGAKP
jgi:serine-type D-Ala-D-Ala carboxypeptidase (penicillin-binding protein 5/6)